MSTKEMTRCVNCMTTHEVGKCPDALKDLNPVCAPATVPTEAKARKALPVFSGVMKYFPNAMLAVAQLSMIGNEQHNPGEPLHWAMEKSTDEGDALSRHQLDAGKRDSDKVRHSTKVAWRAWAQLEREILADQKAGTAPVLDDDGRIVL